MTPLEQEFLHAAQTGNTNRLTGLLSHNRALVNARSESGESAILLAVYNGRQDAAKLLLDYGAELNIWEAAAVGAMERVNEWLKEKPDLVHAYSHDGFTPLQLAAFFGHAETVALLLDHGAEINLHSRNKTFARGVPILQSAVASGNVDVVKILLARGADVNIKGEENDLTPLHAAAFDGQLEIARLLLEHGADPNIKTKNGDTPLAIAKKKGHAQVAALLERVGLR